MINSEEKTTQSRFDAIPKKFTKIASMILNLENDNRPYLRVSVYVTMYVGLLDSGAMCSVMGVEMFRECESRGLILNKCKVKITTADGTSHPVRGYVNVPFVVNNVRRIIPTLVLERAECPLILGMDFWNAFRIKPSFTCNSYGIGAYRLNGKFSIDEMESKDFRGPLDDISPPKQASVSVPHELTDEQRIKLDEIIKKFPFVPENGQLNCTPLTKHVIDTGESEPIRQKQYVMSPVMLKKAIAEVDRLLSRGIIEPVEMSEWLNPFLGVDKPNGLIRLCLDARKLNAVTKKNAYPQQNVNRILSQLSKTKYVTAIDMTDAFYQIPLDENSKAKTAFSVPSKGTYVFKRMVMGLCNSGSTLCALIDRLLGNEFEPYLFIYLDDFIIATDSFEKHLEIMSRLADKLRFANLTISPKKSLFCYKRLKFLGHIIDENGISLDPSRIEAMVNYPEPTCVKDVRRVLGMAGWYRRFIRDFAAITTPMSETLKKKKCSVFKWTTEASLAFKKLIKALTEAPVLATPNYDLPFKIECDASDFACGAVLSQVQDGGERVIAYMSQKFIASQRKYHVTEKECLAVIMGIEKFRPYIEGSHFTVITDHYSLLWLRNLKDPNGRLARWSLRLQGYDFDIIHRKGKDHVVPDALSRMVSSVEIRQFKDSPDVWYRKLHENVMNETQLHDDLRLVNDVVYKKFKVNDVGDMEWRVCVPSECRSAVIKANHDDLTSGHFGVFKTYAKIKRYYFWPGMKESIADYIRNCGVCRLAKPPNSTTQPPMGSFKDPKTIFRHISTDIVGPTVLSKRNKRFLLVAVCSFSKYVIVKPVTNATAKDVVEFLRDDVFMKFAVPKIILSDNGKQYKSKEYERFLNEYGVTAEYTANYHAQANPTEAANKSVVYAIRSYVENELCHRDWDLHLQEIANAMNNSKHTSTGQEPNVIVFGQNMPQRGYEYDNFIDANSDRSRNKEAFDKIREKVQGYLLKAYENSKKRYDLRSREIKYQIGDTVYRKNKKLSDAGAYYSSKLGSRNVKCRIVEQTGSNTYRLRDDNTGKEGIYSAKDFFKMYDK